MRSSVTGRAPGVDRRPRVAFLINELRCRGAQRVFVDDANRFARAGAQVLLCTLYREADAYTLAAELDAAVEHVVLEARGPFDVRAAVRCARLLRSRKSEALITTLNHGNVMGRWVTLASGVKVRLFRRESNTPRRKGAGQRALDVLFDGLTSRIIAVSEEVRADVIRLAPWRASKVVVVPNAVALPAEPARSNRSVPHILTVGACTAQKDHATLVSALGVLARAGHAFSAGIVGGGERHAALQEQAHREGIEARVRFPGALPHDAVLRQYESADIFVLASRWEGCPNVVLEAMAHGLPVVATAVGGVPELVEDRISGLLVPPRNPQALADALACLVSDRRLRHALGDAARRRAAGFAPEPRFERLYDLITRG